MDDYGGMEMRNWAYYGQPLKGDLRLHLMSSVATERGAPKPFLSSGGFLHRECVVPEPPDRMEFMHSDWMNHRENKMVHMLPMNHCYSALPEADVSHGAHVLPLMQSSTLPPPKDEKISAEQSYTLPPPKGDNISVVEEKTGRTKDVPLKKRSQSQAQARPCKASKPKKPKKIAASKDENSGKTGPRGRNMRQSIDLVINGIGLDISSIPTPVCSCTGTPQQCYRWGAGGWQSACCTTNISVYPLPMSTKRRGARIAGRKMSQGAFKKVLENLAAEGYNLSNPIDLRPYWAKHGTNKFVTIR